MLSNPYSITKFFIFKLSLPLSLEIEIIPLLFVNSKLVILFYLHFNRSPRWPQSPWFMSRFRKDRKIEIASAHGYSSDGHPTKEFARPQSYWWWANLYLSMCVVFFPWCNICGTSTWPFFRFRCVVNGGEVIFVILSLSESRIWGISILDILSSERSSSYLSKSVFKISLLFYSTRLDIRISNLVL